MAREWIKANSPGGWIDTLRKERNALQTCVVALEREAEGHRIDKHALDAKCSELMREQFALLRERNAALAKNARLREALTKARLAITGECETLPPPDCALCSKDLATATAILDAALSTPPAEHGAEEGRKARAFDWLDKQRTIQISTVRESECLGNVREIIHRPTGEIHAAKTLLKAIEAARAEGGEDDVAT